MSKVFYFFLFSSLIFSCQTETESAQSIIDNTIKIAGGEAYDKFKLEFDFRGRHYISERDGFDFKYHRITTDSIGTTIDTYSSKDPFKRTVNEEHIAISDSLAGRIENSINSVNYFVLLPYGLNDAAVNKVYLGKTKVKDKEYHKIKVSFDQEGGGKDFEDIYIYWINMETSKIDFLAYSFHVDGGGMRFRETYNERYVSGIRFVDYNNYKPRDPEADLLELDALFEKGELQLLSKIETENIKVSQ
ncbi:MAG: deoxyribose-phosphate aldolase [Bacteroidia bacterium]|nr:deoxyribose-phosphate aldolase [Bacteroidia bacterium]